MKMSVQIVHFSVKEIIQQRKKNYTDQESPIKEPLSENSK